MREASDRALDENSRVIREIGYSKFDAMAEALSALHLAHATENASAAVAAIKLWAQLNNLLVERREVTKPGDSEDADALFGRLVEGAMLGGPRRGARRRRPFHDCDPCETGG